MSFLDKYIIVFVNEDGKMIDYVSSDNEHKYIIAIADELSKQRGEKITPYNAKIDLYGPYEDKDEHF